MSELGKSPGLCWVSALFVKEQMTTRLDEIGENHERWCHTRPTRPSKHEEDRNRVCTVGGRPCDWQPAKEDWENVEEF